MVIFMITLLYAMKTEDLYWSILILLIYNSKKINIESVYRISLRIIIIGIISVLFLCLIGILPDILTSRDTLEQIDYNRHSLGFYHSNVFPLLIFYLEVYYICIVKEKVRDSVIVLFMIFAVIVNVFCRSRNAIIISLLLSVFVILAKKKENGENKLLYHATVLSIPVMSIFSFSMMFLLLRGGIWNTIDTFFSGRFRLKEYLNRKYEICWLDSDEFDQEILDKFSKCNKIRWGVRHLFRKCFNHDLEKAEGFFLENELNKIILEKDYFSVVFCINGPYLSDEFYKKVRMLNPNARYIYYAYIFSTICYWMYVCCYWNEIS